MPFRDTTLEPLHDLTLTGDTSFEAIEIAPDGSYVVVTTLEPVVETFGVAVIAIGWVSLGIGLLVGVIGLLIALLRARRHEEVGVAICRRCAYPVPEGHEGPCIECGRILDGRGRVRAGRSRLRRARAGLTLASAGLAVIISGRFPDPIARAFVDPDDGSLALYEMGVARGLITPGAMPSPAHVSPFGLVVRRLDTATGEMPVVHVSASGSLYATPAVSRDGSRFACVSDQRVLVFDGAAGALVRSVSVEDFGEARLGTEFPSVGGFSDDASRVYAVWSYAPPGSRDADDGTARLVEVDVDSDDASTVVEFELDDALGLNADQMFPIPGTGDDRFLQYPSHHRGLNNSVNLGTTWVRVYTRSSDSFSEPFEVDLQFDDAPSFAKDGSAFFAPLSIRGQVIVRLDDPASMSASPGGTGFNDPVSFGMHASADDAVRLFVGEYASGGRGDERLGAFVRGDPAMFTLARTPNIDLIHSVRVSADGRFAAVQAGSGYARGSPTIERVLMYDISAHPRIAAYLEQRTQGE